MRHIFPPMDVPMSMFPVDGVCWLAAQRLRRPVQVGDATRKRLGSLR